MLQDGYHNKDVKVALDLQTVADSAVVTGDAIDLIGAQSVTFAVPIIAVGADGGALSVEESDDGVAFTAVSADFTLNSGIAASLDQTDRVDGDVARVGYNGVKRYARLVATGGVGGDTDLGTGTAVLGYQLTVPVADTVPEGETA